MKNLKNKPRESRRVKQKIKQPNLPYLRDSAVGGDTVLWAAVRN